MSWPYLRITEKDWSGLINGSADGKRVWPAHSLAVASGGNKLSAFLSGASRWRSANTFDAIGKEESHQVMAIRAGLA